MYPKEFSPKIVDLVPILGLSDKKYFMTSDAYCKYLKMTLLPLYKYSFKFAWQLLALHVIDDHVIVICT